MKSRKIIGIIGKTGTGKSHFLKNYILKNWDENIIIADTMNEYGYLNSFKGFDRFFDCCKKNDKQIYVNGKYPAGTVKILQHSDIEKLLLFSRHVKVKHTLLLEEISLVCSAYKIDNNLAEIIRYGRHHEISIIYTAQRAADISRLLTSQTDLLLSFQQTEKNDIDALKSLNENAKQLKFLKKGEFLTLVSNEKFIDTFNHGDKYRLNKNKIQQID